VWKLLNVVTKLEADGATLYDRQLHTAAILADRAYGDTDAVALGITFGAHPAEMPTRQTQTAEINSSRELRIPHLLLLVNLGVVIPASRTCAKGPAQCSTSALTSAWIPVARCLITDH
jgi:hypothetical protein